MRASLAFQVTLRHFGAWRATVWVLVLATLCAVAAWITAQPDSPSLAVWVAAGAVVASVLALGRSLATVAPASLRWDGQVWHLGPDTPMGDEPDQGSLSVSVDLGAWMLLRFATASHGRRRRIVWLPAQRRGLEPQWHALRCAVHAPRPAPGTGPSEGL